MIRFLAFGQFQTSILRQQDLIFVLWIEMLIVILFHCFVTREQSELHQCDYEASREDKVLDHAELELISHDGEAAVPNWRDHELHSPHEPLLPFYQLLDFLLLLFIKD